MSSYNVTGSWQRNLGNDSSGSETPVKRLALAGCLCGSAGHLFICTRVLSNLAIVVQSDSTPCAVEFWQAAKQLGGRHTKIICF